MFKKLVNFIISILFTMSFCSLCIYAFYYLKLKNSVNNTAITILQLSIVNYRNIGIFCLIFGLILLLIKNIINYYEINKVKYISDSGLNKISTRNMNYEIRNSIKIKNRIDYDTINTLLNDKVLKIRFIGSELNEKVVRFSHYGNNTLEVIDLNKNTKKDYILRRLNSKDLVYCDKCKNIYKHKCINCNKENEFSIVRYVVNLLEILLLFILILLFANLIYEKMEI